MPSDPMHRHCVWETKRKTLGLFKQLRTSAASHPGIPWHSGGSPTSQGQRLLLYQPKYSCPVWLQICTYLGKRKEKKKDILKSGRYFSLLWRITDAGRTGNGFHPRKFFLEDNHLSRQRCKQVLKHHISNTSHNRIGSYFFHLLWLVHEMRYSRTLLKADNWTPVKHGIPG